MDAPGDPHPAEPEPDNDDLPCQNPDLSETLDLEAVMEQDLEDDQDPSSKGDSPISQRRANSKDAEMQQKVKELETQLETTNKQLQETTSELDSTKKKLAKFERLYDKVNQYNDDLRKQVDNLSKELHSCKKKLKRRSQPSLSVTEVGTQVSSGELDISVTADLYPVQSEASTAAVTIENQAVDWSSTDVNVADTTTVDAQQPTQSTTTTEQTDTEPQSLAESLKAAAEQAVQQQGFVFDDRTGLYYDYSTGYYYNAERGLYYEPNSGTYYYFDPESQSYQFHSQVDVTQYAADYYQHNDQHGAKTHRELGQKTTTKRKQQETMDSQDEKKQKPSSEGRQKSREDKKRELKKTKRRDKDNGKKKKDKEEEEDKEDDQRERRRQRRNKHHKKKRKEEKNSALDKRRHERKSERSRSSRDRGYREEDDDDGQERSKERTDKEHLVNGNKSHSKKRRSRREDSQRDRSEERRLSSRRRERRAREREREREQEREREREREKEREAEKNKTRRNTESDSRVESDLEEGELSEHSVVLVSSSSSSSLSSSSEEDMSEISMNGVEFPAAENEDVEEEQAIYYPPCIRVMVTESDCLDPGSLFIITVTGATIGRDENLGHTLLIADEQVSKMHCDIRYNEAEKYYMIQDHASQNGTFVNDERLSEPKVISEPHPIRNGDTVRLGSTSLGIHIHPGTETCDDCEPGLVQAKLQAERAETREVVVLTKAEKERLRRKNLKQIKKKFGLESAAYVENDPAINNPNYKDKAGERRRTVGSDNPYQKDDAPASVDRAISVENKGHKLLAKMGWKEGEGLGKSQPGITEPIQVNIRSKQSAGLGSGMSYERSMDEGGQPFRGERWIKAGERFQRAVAAPTASASKPAQMAWVQGQTVNQPEDRSESENIDQSDQTGAGDGNT